MAAQPSSAHTFQSEPHSVSAGKPKYRDAPAALQTNAGTNIMWDSRVVRGSTYASHVLPTTVAPDPVSVQKKAEKKKLRDFKKKTAERRQTVSTPEPVDGRKHMDVQTEQYLEAISDRPAEETLGTQTDEFLDRPPSPLFIPQKHGVDCATQIEEGDLFDFDFEVEPILEVLVGKTLEQSLMEVLEEEELAAIRAHEEQFDQIRAAELAEAQRMEEAERRRMEEKENRLRQERERLARESEVSHKVAARGFATKYVGNVVSEVFDELEETGFFYDPLVREVEEEVVPWILEGVEEGVSQASIANSLVDGALGTVLQIRDNKAAAAKAKYDAIVKAKEEAAAAAAAAAEEARKKAEEEAAAAAAEAEFHRSLCRLQSKT